MIFLVCVSIRDTIIRISNDKSRNILACRVHCIAGREEGEGEVGGRGSGVFPAGADGGEAVDVQEVAGGGAGNCGDDFCAGDETGTGEGAGNEGGGVVFAAEGWERAGGDSGPADEGVPVSVGFFGRSGRGN